MSEAMSMMVEEVAPARPDLCAIRSGLVIEQRWLDKILSEEKTWEMRSQRTHKREWIGLIRKGSQTIMGVCRIVGEHGPLTLDQMKATVEKHRIPLEEIQQAYNIRRNRAWVLGGVHKLRKLIRYQHRGGAQNWVIFDDQVRALLKDSEVLPVIHRG